LDGVLPEMVIQGVPEMVIQGMEKQAKIADSVHLGKIVELNEKADSPLASNGVPPSPAASALLEEYLTSFRRTEPLSLLDAPILVQLEGDSTCVGRRSGRLEKKNKDCSIPTAKRAEHRLLEAFGDLPKKEVMPATAQAARARVPPARRGARNGTPRPRRPAVAPRRNVPRSTRRGEAAREGAEWLSGFSEHQTVSNSKAAPCWLGGR
jgi:hypothetical protein